MSGPSPFRARRAPFKRVVGFRVEGLGYRV